jgi:hypothetical protein
MSDHTTNASDSGAPGAEFNPNHASNARLLGRSLRWPTTPEIRADVVAKLHAALAQARTAREIASISKVLAQVEAQNQKDEHAAQGIGEYREPVRLNVFVQEQQQPKGESNGNQ